MEMPVAEILVVAFQRYNDGATMKELMNWLNDSGVTTNRNQKFTYNSVQKLLTNKRYIGENRFILPKHLQSCDVGTLALPKYTTLPRSEERRVGKECRSRWSPYH